jgi:anti-anti-sigma factor
MFVKEDKDKGVVLRIKGSMSVTDIASIHKELLSCFDDQDDLTLNLKEVDFCDVTGIQVLHSAKKTAESMGKTFFVEDVSNSIVDTFNRAGLDPETVLTKK